MTLFKSIVALAVLISVGVELLAQRRRKRRDVAEWEKKLAAINDAHKARAGGGNP